MAYRLEKQTCVWKLTGYPINLGGGSKKAALMEMEIKVRKTEVRFAVLTAPEIHFLMVKSW